MGVNDDIDEKLQRTAQLRHETQRTGFAFISTDLDTSLTFANLARQAVDDPDKRARNRKNARRGYDAILHFLRRFDAQELAPAEKEEVDRKLAGLKSALTELGETFD